MTPASSSRRLGYGRRSRGSTKGPGTRAHCPRRREHLDDQILCVLYGGKGIRKALRDIYGDNAIVQRGQVHKRRNVRDHLPKHRQDSVDRQLREAYASATAVLAHKRIKQLILWLERNDEGAAAGSLSEGLEEALTVLKLDLPPAYERSSPPPTPSRT